MNRVPLFGPDILNQVSGPKKVEMLQLIHRLNSQQIQIPEFLANSRIILGHKVYNQMVSAMNEVNLRNHQVLQSQKLSTADIVPHPVFRTGDDMASMPLVMDREPTTVSMAEAPGQADVSKMDADSLQDILQYSGVNLKEEADNILKEQEYLVSQVSQELDEDSESRAAGLFNVDVLQDLLQAAGNRYGLKNLDSVDPLILEFLLWGLQSRLASILDKLVLVSRNRVDVLRAHFKLKIDNDPKRQLFVLDRILSERNNRYFCRAGETQPSPKKTKTGQSPQPSPSLAQLAPSNTSSMEREDLYIKTRITNATALNQLGIPLKNWMLEGSTTTSSAMMVSQSKPSRPEASRSVSQSRLASAESKTLSSPRSLPSSSPSQSSAGFLGISDKEWRPSVFSRRITVHDCIFFMTHDRVLSHSPILSRAYLLLKPAYSAFY